MIRRILTAVLLALFLPLSLSAQQLDEKQKAALSSKLDEYIAGLAGDPADVQDKECDFIISNCTDSLVRQWVTLYLFDHFLNSKIMGDDAVAVYLADNWLLNGKVSFKNEVDRVNAKIFADFNRSSLIGKPAPELLLKDHNELTVNPLELSAGKYALLYFYDTDCSTCAVETVRLKQFLSGNEFPMDVYAIYTADDEASWAKYRAMNLNLPGIVHLWDPEMDSDFPRKYGILQTPGMFLVAPDGTILGRRLDTEALSLLIRRISAPQPYAYGSEASKAFFDTVFGDDANDSDIVNMAGYLLSKSRKEDSEEEFRHTAGDLLYYLTSRRGEAYRQASQMLIEKFIRPFGADAEVAALADFTYDLLSRTPVGSVLPALTLHGTLRSRPGLFCKGIRTGAMDLSSLGKGTLYLVFHTAGCGNCGETLSAVERRLKEGTDKKVRYLLIDMDELFSSYPEEAKAAMDAFDLSVLPFVLEARDGKVVRRYVDL